MITIYHNPACGISRTALGLIRNSGAEPRIIEYLQAPPERSKLIALLAAMGIPVRALLRQKGTPYEELRLGDPRWRDDELIDFMLSYPLLINRPIVVTPLGTALCRPPKRVLGLLSAPQQGEFRKENGEPLIDSQGRRIMHAD